MNVWSVSINRPVLTIVLSLLVLLFGFIGFNFLGVREFPSVDPPIITVSTNYTGANADVIESQITEPLESSINGIAGISSISSISNDGRSTITVEFDLEVDLEAAANDVRDRVSRTIRNLPPDCDPPTVTKSDANANPIVVLTLQSNERSLLSLSDIANNVFKERLQTIPGVSEIRIWGEKKYAMRLLLNPAKMASYHLTPTDVKNALLKENIELPSGRIEGYRTEMIIRTMGRMVTEEDFNNLILKDSNGAIVRLSDVGYAQLSAENERSIMRGNGGIPMAAVAVTPQPGANYIEIADEVYKRVDIIKKDLPKDINVGMAIDATTSIRHAITEVEETIFIAFLLVVCVIFLFLRNWRTTMIPVVTIPISLIGSFFVMYISGFSINILTLLAIVLATGLVVDDAIVVLENIYQKIEAGMNPIEAGHKGSKEIFFAIISTTITLIAVFFPIIFLQGLTGRLFREFGIVVASSVAISAFISLTLTPMMSSRLLHKNKHESKFFDKTETFINNLIDGYNRSLTNFINRRWIAIVIMAVSILIIVVLIKFIPSELAPLEDKGRLQVQSTAPEGVSFELMDRYISDAVALVDTLPEKDAILAVTSPGFGGAGSANSGFIRVSLSEPGTRKRSQQEIADSLSDVFKQFTFAKSFIMQEQTIGRSGGLPIQYVLQASNFDKLKEYLPFFMQKAQTDSLFQVVDVNLKFNKPELRVEIDRDKARLLGVSVRDIAEALQLYYSGQRYGYFILDNKQYQVIGQAQRNDRSAPADLSSIYIKNNRDELVQLDNFIKITEHSSPPMLYRYNRYVSATISASPANGKTLGQGIAEMDKIAKSTLDDSFTTSLAGTSKEFAESSNSLLFAFLLALIIVYLILAAQFESFRNPLIIMFTVPLALAGAILSLWLTGQTMNIFSQIGIIVLVGIVTKNGILIVEFANQRRSQGLSVNDAVIDAATKRLRPILMTSLATILGALPIALALGAASKSRIPMGITIIGGLLFSLVLTLYVIPALYTYLSKDKPHK
jgi:hydrophobe/amphiphile efflux-1 (HAE1) family protein